MSKAPHSVSTANTHIRGISIGDYLIHRLGELGVRHVFGIPGDYVLGFYTKLEESSLNIVGCTREDCAGFAADAYARINGLGVVCVTYCVGGLSLCNSVACAYAEKSPVLVISGSPGTNEREKDPLLHHKVKDFDTQAQVLRQLCLAGSELDDPETAFQEIDRVLEAILRYKRPGFLELPRNLVNVIPQREYVRQTTADQADPEALQEALAESIRRIQNAKKVVIIAGVELHRFGLQDEVVKLAERAGIPFCSTALGKSVLSEVHPLYVGLYEGAMGREEVTRFVEESDLVILLGAFMTDINLGIYTANLDQTKCIHVTSEQLRISRHVYENVDLAQFICGLSAAGVKVPRRALPPQPSAIGQVYQLRADAPCTIRRLMARLNESLDENTVVIADVGDAMFASSELTIQKRTKFLSPFYYTSMGFAVPAALGVQIGQRELRPVVLVGDGAFQMTGTEMSSIVRYGLNPVIIVLDNKGYGTERKLHPGEFEFNDVHPWAYHKLTEVFRGGKGYEVRTEGEFDKALRAALADTSQMSLIQVHLDGGDCSQPLNRLAEKLSQRVV